jgi:hypothetical protein
MKTSIPHGLVMLVNEVLRRIFGPNRKEVIAGCRKFKPCLNMRK